MKIIDPKVFPNFLLTFLDYPDPSPKGSVSLYLPGCPHRCEGCHFPDSHDYECAIDLPIYEVFRRIKAADKLNSKCVTLLGGDPLHTPNLFDVHLLIGVLKANGYKVCVYTGYSFSEANIRLCESVDFLKTGLYDKSKAVKSDKNSQFIQFASTNQELYKFQKGTYKLLSRDGKYYFNKWRNYVSQFVPATIGKKSRVHKKLHDQRK